MPRVSDIAALTDASRNERSTNGKSQIENISSAIHYAHHATTQVGTSSKLIIDGDTEEGAFPFSRSIRSLFSRKRDGRGAF
jgi:hypothetical protein